jgi:hypothetical protein
MVHTRRTDTDGTIILGSASGAFEGELPKNKLLKDAMRGEVYISVPPASPPGCLPPPRVAPHSYGPRD